jgi:hypothetical protein
MLVDGRRLRKLHESWPEIGKILGLTGHDITTFVDQTFVEQGLTLYAKNSYGLWNPIPKALVPEKLSDLSVSDYANCWANGLKAEPRDYHDFRVTPADFDRLIKFANTIANALPLTNATAVANHYPQELSAAIEAFNAVRENSASTAKRSPKAALLAWLVVNKPDLSKNARERIATVANWQPSGGAPKSSAK